MPLAKTDVRSARKWYGEINKVLPVRFKKELKLVFDALREWPTVHAIRYKNVRFAQLNKFPYAVHYFIDDEAAIVNIIAVCHNALNPEKWRNP